MTTKEAVDNFLSLKSIAVVGVSREGKKFGNMAYKDLKSKGYNLFPINPHADEIEGDRCYSSINDLPEQVGGVLIVVPPEQTEKVVMEASEAGINRVWMQQGAESTKAIQYCQEHSIDAVHGECILMFAEPAGFPHRAHRWVWGLIGKLPD